MKVLMISADRGLFGASSSGDAIERHKKYADFAGSLDIVVFTPKGFIQKKEISNNLTIYGTNSYKIFHWNSALSISKQLYKKNKYDLLVTQEFGAPVGVKLKKIFGIPWIISIHSMFFSYDWLKTKLINYYFLFKIKKSLKFADGFRVTNNIIKNQLLDWGVVKPIKVLPTPVDVEKFKFSERQIKKENSQFQILYVGRLSVEKNIGMLIDTILELDNCELTIVGEGQEEQTLKDKASGSRKIKFLGPKSHNELVDIYKNSDIFVLPSNTESFGKVLIEAGASGCALIATETTGASQIIQNGQSGLLVPVGDKFALKEALNSLIRDADLLNKLSREAVNMSEIYRDNDNYLHLVDFWKQIVLNSKI